jgi:NAD(P)-dependent dehydrogenase (short-subunit alcohol dehydrogenase family)
MKLLNKVALITGGGSGIGAATAQAFAREGARVAVAGRTLGKVQAVVAGLREHDNNALAIEADVSRSADVQRMMAEAMQHFGQLDIVFNNAGISPVGRVTEISEAEWDECIAVDLTSVFLVCKYAIPHMQQNGGVILNTAGTFGLRGAPQKAAYCAAKAGVVNLTRAIALDYARDNIRCNVICPGFIDTPLTADFEGDPRAKFLEDYQPLRGMTTPEEVAELAVYLASDAAKMMTGQPFVIDAGQQAGLF